MRALVVDDEPIARARIVRLLARIEGVELAGEASSGHEAIERMRELRPEVLILDIDMPGLDGMAVAEQPDAPPIVFTTAHRDYAVDAFEANAVDYLLKPISKERLEKALQKVRARLAEAPLPEALCANAATEAWRIVVRDGSMKRFVDARRVEAFIADRKYITFELDGRELLVRESLDALEARLAPLGFLRVNRGALVRRDAIAAYDTAGGGFVVVGSGERIAVSRRAAAEVREALGA